MIMSSRGRDQTLALWHKPCNFVSFPVFYPDISHNTHRKERGIQTVICMLHSLPPHCIPGPGHVLWMRSNIIISVWTKLFATAFTKSCLVSGCLLAFPAQRRLVTGKWWYDHWSSDKMMLSIMSVSQICWSQLGDSSWRVTTLCASSCGEGEGRRCMDGAPGQTEAQLPPRVINITLGRPQQMPLYLCHDGRFIRCLHYA